MKNEAHLILFKIPITACSLHSIPMYLFRVSKSLLNVAISKVRTVQSKNPLTKDS